MLSILALGMLVAVGAAFDGSSHESGSHGGDHHDNHDFGSHPYYDWLNPGGYSSYSWYTYPAYTYTYPAYTYTYPTYTYPSYYYTAPAPVVYPTYNYYYDPVVYDPWYATNVYGWGGATYYYSNSWSWSHNGGFFF